MIIQFNRNELEISRKYQGMCLCKSNSFRRLLEEVALIMEKNQDVLQEIYLTKIMI